MVIKIEYDTWEEAQFLLNNVKNQAKHEDIEIDPKPSEAFIKTFGKEGSK